MASLTYDLESKTFNAEIAINQTDSESTLSKEHDLAEFGSQSESLDNLSDTKIVPDPKMMSEFYQDSKSEETIENESLTKTRVHKKIKSHADPDPSINIKFNLINNNSNPINTNFYLHKGQNTLSDIKCELIPNVSFDVNRIYSESSDDNTYVIVDVYKKTIKQTEAKMSQSEKPIGQLRLKLESHMKEKTSTSLDHHNSLIAFTAYRKRIN